ncbi:TonB-dependent siderophore receptor [Steroidobacter flavus]|uniref:TonB-dependent siderophore receptor n=1 Tax=Steroidobacter flavus TaxID=1842136 RepID=A0ABV8SWM9_9GAMM
MTTRIRVMNWQLLGAIALSLSSLCVAHAQSSPASGATVADAKLHAFDIPTLPLAQAAIRFSEQAGVQLLFDADLAKGVSASEVKGRLTVQDALLRLLGRTGLRWRYLNSTTITIEPAPSDARVIGPVRVEGVTNATNGINGSTDVTATEGTKSYTSGALSIASKTPQSIKDTPQSVSVITQQRLQDQNLTDLNTVLDQSTGITLIKSDSLSNDFYSRGFQVTKIQIDGGAPLSTEYGYVPLLDMAMYDHAEILRGADGMFNGYGDPGGVVNLTRKRPLDRDQVTLDMHVGSWNDYRVVVDATAPLGFEGRLRGRAVISYEDKDYFYDVASDNHTLAYGIVEADVTPTTQVSAGFSFTRQDAVPFVYGLMRYSDGRDLHLPRSTALTPEWSYWNFETKQIFAQVEQSLGERWTMKLNVTRQDQESHQKYSYVYGPVDPVSLQGPYVFDAISDFSNVQSLADVTVSGEFELFGHTQSLVFGANYQQVDGGDYKFHNSTYPGETVNVFEYDPSGYPMPGDPGVQYGYPDDGQEQSGAYLNARLTFWQPLHVLLGMRYSRYEYGQVMESFYNGSVSRQRETHSRSDFTWPPTYSMVYDLGENLSAYGSYTDIYSPQSRFRDRNDQPIEPITGANLELGLKYQSPDRRLNAALAYYRIEQKNFAERDPSVPPSSDPDSRIVCCYLNTSDRVNFSQGVDLELTGELLPGLQTSFAYTFNQNEIRGLDAYADQGKPLVSRSPEHLLKLWASYRFQQGAPWLRALTLSGGVNAQTSNYNSGSVCIAYIYDTDPLGRPRSTCTRYADYEFTIGAYAILSGHLAYEINPRWRAGLNIENLLDRRYYQTVGRSDYGNWYGEPRSFTLSLRGQF